MYFRGDNQYQHFITINIMNNPQTRHALNNLNFKNVQSVEGFDSPQRGPLAAIGQPKKSVVIVQEGPPDSKSQKESSKYEKQSPEQAALVNSQLIHLPVQSSQVEAVNTFPPSLQPVTHSHLHQNRNATYANNNVVQSNSLALKQLAKTVSQPVVRPPLPPSNGQRNLPILHSNQNAMSLAQGPKGPLNQQYQSQRMISQQSVAKVQAQNRVSPPSRPSSSVPTVVHFNYQLTQKQPPPPQQIQIVTFPTQNIQPVLLPPPPPPKPVVQPDHHYQQLINENHHLKQQIVLWQQRYFTVIERFHFCYQRIETITREYIVIHQKVKNCNDPHQLQALKERMASLQEIISQTEQELVQAVNRNKEVTGDTTNWKAKYEELLKVSSHQKSPDLLNKLEALQSHLTAVESDYERVLALNQQAHQNQKKYIEEINRLNQMLSQQGEHNPNYQYELQRFREELLMKDDEINTLRMIVEAQKADSANHSSQKYEQFIHKLTQEKEELYNALKQTQQESTIAKKAHEQKIAEYEYELKGATQEIKRFQLIIEQRGRADSMQKSQTLSTNQITHEKELEILRLKHELDIKQETQIAERKMFNSKIQELTSAKDSAIAILQEKASILESDLNKKDSLIRSLRDKVYQLEESLRIKNLDDKYQKGSAGSVNNAVKSSGIHTGQQHQSDKELHNLRTKLKQQNLKLEQVKGQVSEYKRLSLESQDALTAAKHENAILKKQMDDLNYKINEMKQTIRQLQQGSKAYHQLKVYSEGLKQALHQKEKEILMLNHRIEDIQLMQTTKIKPPQLAQLAQFTQITQQNQMLQASIYKKDLEISKLKQNNQLLQSSYDQLEVEFQKISQKKNQNDKQFEHQKNELKNKLSTLQSKCLDYERKVAGLEEVRTILQQQLTALTSELQIKIESLQRSQIQLKQERAKIKTFESEIQSKMSEGEELKIKIKEGEKKNSNVLKEIQLELQKKNEELNSRKSEYINLQTKLFDLQTMIKTKEARIKQLEKNNQNLKLKMGNVDSNLDQLKYLKHKISEYESKVSALTYKATSRLPNTEPTQIFQRKVIYQLKLENEALRQQLNLVNRPTNDSNNDQLPKKDLKERLTDFNQRLEQVIGEHFNGDLVVNGQNELFKKYERDRRQLIEKYNEEITQLKLKILQLQSQQPTQYKVTYSKGHYSPESIYNEQIQFYREKNIELEERVDNHIKVNKDLKEQIERLMRGHQDEYSLAYYSEQLQKANELNNILQDKIKKANAQIKKLRQELARNNVKPVDSQQFEIRISEMNRKISQFVLEINELEREKAELNQLVVSLRQEVQKSKTVQDELKYSREEISRQLELKQEDWHNETTKLNSRIKLLQSQIERLNQIISKRQSNESSQLNLLRGKFNDLQDQNRKLKVKIEEHLLVQERNQRDTIKWQTQIQSLQIEIQRLKDQNEGANRRVKEAEAEITSLRGAISDYEGKLRSKQSLFEDHSHLQNQLNQEIARLQLQCALLSQQLERVNKLAQKKIAQKETENFKIKQTLTERDQQIYSLEEQLSQIKISLMRASETSQQAQSLREEINRLNYTLMVKNSDYQRRGQEINDLNGRIRLTEQQIRELRKTAEVKASEFSAIIKRLEAQLREAQKGKESSHLQLNSVISQLQSQLRQTKRSKQSEIVQYQSRISTLQYQLIELQQRLKSSSDKQQRLHQLQWQFQQNRNQQNIEIQALRSGIKQYELEVQHRQQIILQNEQKSKHMELQLTEIIRSRDVEISQLRLHLNQWQAEIQRTQQELKEMHNMVAHIQHLEAEIVKLNQYIEQQQHHYEELLAKVRKQAHSNTNEAENIRAEYEVTIRKLQTTIQTLNIQLSEVRTQFSNSESERTKLLTVISSLEVNITNFQQTISTLQLQITNLHQTISVREKEYLELNVRYEEHMAQLQTDLQNYRLVINQLQERLKITDQQFNALIKNSQYSIQFVRSVLISVETMLHEKQCTHEAVYAQLGKGLEECQRWNEIGV